MAYECRYKYSHIAQQIDYLVFDITCLDVGKTDIKFYKFDFKVRLSTDYLKMSL